MAPFDALKNFDGEPGAHVFVFVCSAVSDLNERLVPTSSSEQCITGKGVSLASEYVPLSIHRRLVPPFTPSHDIPRGLIQAAQSTFSYALMLVVMYVRVDF